MANYAVRFAASRSGMPAMMTRSTTERPCCSVVLLVSVAPELFPGHSSTQLSRVGRPCSKGAAEGLLLPQCGVMCRRRMVRQTSRVMPARLLLSLLQPLLAFLLLAGMPSAEFVRAQDGRLVRVIETGSKSLWLHRERSTASSSLEAKATPDRLDGDAKTSDPIAGAPDFVVLALDRARLIRIGRACYPTAPPSHRPCAAPPTGPPSLA